MLEPRKIGLESLLGLQEDVEAKKVEEGQLQVLRRRIVHVGDRRGRILATDCSSETLEKALGPPATMPSNDRGRNLVSHRIAEYSGVARAGPRSLSDPRLDRSRPAGILEKSHVLLPRQSNKDEQAVLGASRATRAAVRYTCGERLSRERP